MSLYLHLTTLGGAMPINFLWTCVYVCVRVCVCVLERETDRERARERENMVIAHHSKKLTSPIYANMK